VGFHLSASERDLIDQARRAFEMDHGYLVRLLWDAREVMETGRVNWAEGRTQSCRQCGMTFVGEKQAAYCSSWCGDLFRARRRVGHGTSRKYRAGCRCKACRAWQAQRVAAQRARRSPDAPELVHGSRSTFLNHRCRCGPCTEAQRAYQAERKARRMAS
jgi:hypothetical protein